MITIGLTGGIGSGKTTVCKVWEGLGAKILYADDLAKFLMTNDPELRSKIQTTFGIESYHKDGTLNREYLAEEAFQKGRVKEFNAIVHPRIFSETERLKKAAEKDGYPVFVKEAALLLDYGRPENTDYVVVVIANDEKRIARVKDRDHVTSLMVEQRITKQKKQEYLLKFADFVIENNGSVKELEEESVRLYKKILAQGKK